MDIPSLLVADAQSTKLVDPSEGPLDDPAQLAQAATALSVTHREKRHDAALTHSLPDCLCIIATVAKHTIRTIAWTSTLSL